MILISAFAILSPQPANTSLTQFRYQHPCLAGPCDPGSPCPVLSLAGGLPGSHGPDHEGGRRAL